MKKIIILTALSLFVASSAFAATGLTLDLTKTGLTVYGAKASATKNAAGTIAIGKTSTGVAVGLNTAASGYAVQTQHKNGTKAYGSAFDSTSIWVKDVTAGTADTTGYGTTGSDAFGEGWTTM